MSAERLERLEEILAEAIEAVEEEKGQGGDALSLVRQAHALAREMADEQKPERWDVSHPDYRRAGAPKAS